ncbi:MAG: hypothetical protein F4Y20_13210 [Acidobacteria bacterium]|nr:hypothetical protein [Acidobacteriota bacterium]MYH22195.1 hypothetical protein [Acidobacteriota bacterium]MYK78162.1 hypothetical protein [Acidobacteriota bacterium]
MVPISNETFAQFASFLTAWAILSIILEEAFGTLFNWRFYRNRWDGKGLKVPIVFVGALALCISYGIDLLYEFLQISGIAGSNERHFIGYVVSAAFLCGGSSTVFRVVERVRKAASG